MKGGARLACVRWLSLDVSVPSGKRRVFRKEFMDKVALTIDGLEVTADRESTILQTALRSGIYIPHLCYHPGLTTSGVCRLCLVEVEGKIVISCRTSVAQGMVVRTRSPEVDSLRRVMVETLVTNHHSTCRGCPGSGPCALQKIMTHVRIDRERVRRLRPPIEELPEDHSNPYFVYDPNKCVLCKICVNTCAKIQSALHVVGRGHNATIAFFGDCSRCESCKECVAGCPVGALRET
jgi:predicted molibdopterin-dependent oxidoreductase YjgC